MDPTLAALGSKHGSPADIQALRRDYTRPRLGCCCVAQHRRRPCRRPQIDRNPLCTPNRPNLDPLVSLTPFPIQTSLSYLITFSAYVKERGQRGQRVQSMVTEPQSSTWMRHWAYQQDRALWVTHRATLPRLAAAHRKARRSAAQRFFASSGLTSGKSYGKLNTSG